jgi:hypothetical protein
MGRYYLPFGFGADAVGRFGTADDGTRTMRAIVSAKFFALLFAMN